MGSKDSYSKKFLQNNEVFADAFNMLIYNGQQIIRPDELTPLDTSELTIPYSDKKFTEIQRYRDILKLLTAKRTDRVIYLILGIENQTDIHYAMPVRNMLYDAIQYSMQIEDLRQKNKESGVLDSNTFLSGIRREDRIIPIITLTVYFGTQSWDGPVSLKEMFSDVDEECMKFIQDYRIFLLAPQQPKSELLKLSSELREVMLFINSSQDKNQLRELLHSDKRFGKLSIDASFLLNSFAGKDLNIDPQKENFDMCKAIDDMITDAIHEGELRFSQKIAILSSENSALSSENSALFSENSALTSENSVLKETNASLLSENEMLKLELKRLKSQNTN